MKLPTKLLENVAKQFNPTSDEVQEIRRRNAADSARALEDAAAVERRCEMIAKVAPERITDAFERYIGENDLLPINYLTIGYSQSRSVGRVRFFDRDAGKGAVATGFLISEDLLVTNHHVFPVDDAVGFDQHAKDPTIEFNHEYDMDGRCPEPIVFELEPQRFLHTNAALDLVIIAVKATDRTGAHALRDQGYLVLNGARGKAGLGDFATIIQHPRGAEKQIAIRKNEVINVELPDALIYTSDTAPGSSGAPVFNDQWQVIALHSAGVPKKNAKGEYVDASGEVIEQVDGAIDGDRVVWVSNRGIRVSAIMAHLRASAALVSQPLIQNLFSPAYTDSRPFAYLSRPAPLSERAAAPARGAAPSQGSAAAPMPPININISISPHGHATTTLGPPTAPSALAAASAFEKKYEDELDFSECTGFDDHFMGVYLPMPKPKPKLRKKLAFLLESPKAYTLDYHHFSTIHHAVRRVPVVSGINVNARSRYAALDEEGSRVDKWFRDNRIDYDVQLNDTFYAKSGFDRGHMARREDAEWGRSLARAKLSADLTCSYANAAPQVRALNRAKFGDRGKWGLLELELLEKGIENEEGKAGRMCVFAGPLFDDDDPAFKGIQVALDFFKVVLWYDGGGELRTTCYRLSQEKLVGHIEFEVLRFDEVFKTYQLPIGAIEKATGLEFHPNITSRDTSSGDEEIVE
jgi:endonuclease G, mitochondrial